MSLHRSGACMKGSVRAYVSLLEQVAKVNKFTMDNVSRVRKRLKALRDNVRADKEKRNTESLLQVWSFVPSFGVSASFSNHCLRSPYRLQHASVSCSPYMSTNVSLHGNS